MAASTFLRMLLLIFPALACSSQEAEYVLEGTVTRVVDGDTIDVQLDSGPIRVRMQGIDAPERGQPMGSDATTLLRQLVDDREVELLPAESVSYTRMVARVYVGDTDINAEMIRRGFAMAERRFLREFDDGADYCVFEHAARSDRAGIWELPADQRVAPWEWRRLNQWRGPFTDYGTETVEGCVAAIGKPHSEPAVSVLPDEPGTGEGDAVNCASKSRCEEMVDCAEAKRFSQQCGLPRDGDGDGVPCEASLCR